MFSVAGHKCGKMLKTNTLFFCPIALLGYKSATQGCCYTRWAGYQKMCCLIFLGRALDFIMKHPLRRTLQGSGTMAAKAGNIAAHLQVFFIRFDAQQQGHEFI